MAQVAEAKQELRSAGARGETLLDLARSIVRQLQAERATVAATRQLLRDYGHEPDGKRLAGAVGEALRHPEKTVRPRGNESPS
jgi:hypothetical protein